MSPPLPATGAPVPLASLGDRVVVRIARVGADASTARHLAALGVRGGAIVELVRNLGADGVVVGFAEDRLALPRDLARLIQAAPIERPRAPGEESAP